ncbi:entericidin EcnA/B family protein [Ovoidimarina sediminis]|nr:entericidin EcnA/B family protein [Rhodophyticola sp. MJ-SS7]MDU8941883.1 entericidin EcnA/B family protein [Rhodophyticola sp. MJ-SS7]
MLRFLLIVFLGFAVAGCATVEGMGEDISGGARKVRAAL